MNRTFFLMCCAAIAFAGCKKEEVIKKIDEIQALTDTNPSSKVEEEEMEEPVDRTGGITILTRTRQRGIFSGFTSLKESLDGNADMKLFKNKEVRETLLDLYDFIYEGDIPAFILRNKQRIPKGYSLIGINIYGKFAAIPVPDNRLAKDYYILDKTATPRTTFDCKPRSYLGVVFYENKGCDALALFTNPASGQVVYYN